jgi:hypothetical protein
MNTESSKDYYRKNEKKTIELLSDDDDNDK